LNRGLGKKEKIKDDLIMAEYKILDDLKYTKAHEWIKIDGNTVTMGITDFAQKSLSDIVYVELPSEDLEFQKGDSIGVIESVKAAEDFYAPVSGKISAINNQLQDNPALLNSDPYGEGWIIKIEMKGDESEMDLLNVDEYKNHVKEQES
jgi:glycine cleavage system H protein